MRTTGLTMLVLVCVFAAGCDDPVVDALAAEVADLKDWRDDVEPRLAALEEAAGIDPAWGSTIDQRLAALEDLGLTGDRLDGWDAAHGWGDHAGVGYVTVEEDPAFVGSPAENLTAQDLDDLHEAHGWGDHGAVGYLESFTESDPVAMNEGFLTAETDPVATAAGYATTADLALCPVGYVHDPAETGFTLCYDPDSALAADEVVRVGDFWVDRYEASAWSAADCSGTQFGATGDDYPAELPDTGNWETTTPQVYACSVAGVTPSSAVTWFQAQQACAASGKSLCSNAQWQAAAAGTWDPGANDGGGGGSCHTSGSTRRLTGQAGSTPALSTSCMSSWGAEDMVGNLKEWVADWYVGGPDWQSSYGQAASAWPAGFGGDLTWNVNGGAHDGSTWAEGSPAGAARGGDWDDGTDGGSFALYLNAGPSDPSIYTGFRCCVDR